MYSHCLIYICTLTNLQNSVNNVLLLEKTENECETVEQGKEKSEHAIFNIPRGEVVRRLRERGKPIRLFGESDRDVCLRLRQLELLDTETDKVCKFIYVT